MVLTFNNNDHDFDIETTEKSEGFNRYANNISLSHSPHDSVSKGSGDS